MAAVIECCFTNGRLWVQILSVISKIEKEYPLFTCLELDIMRLGYQGNEPPTVAGGLRL